MPVLFTNNATATLASSITNSATSITLTTGQGALFPSLTGSNYFYGTLANSSNTLEIVKVTARSGDVLTVVRAQEGTTASAFAAADKFELRTTAAGLTNMAQLDAANTFSGTSTFSNTVTISSATLTSSTGTLAGTWAGTPTFSGAVTFSGSPVFSSAPVVNNAVTIDTKDAGGTLRSLIGCASDNTVNIYNSGNWLVRILNQAGSAALVTLSDVSGNMTANSVSVTSDERLKNNWRDLSAGFLQDLAGVKTGIYDRTDTGATQVGVSAQSLQAVLPQAVQEGADGFLSVVYGNAALVAAVALAREVTTLRHELNELKEA